MNADNVFAFLILAMAPLFILVRRYARAKHIFVPDYKRGVRFVNGSFANVLGPGSYQPRTSKERIEVIDMRPQPIILEKISYRDACQNESFLTIGAELLVHDPHLAVTMLKNQIGDTLPIVRETLRSVASRGIAGGSTDFRNKTAADITQAVNVQLGRVGMEISNVEIIESWSRSDSGRVTAVSN